MNTKLSTNRKFIRVFMNILSIMAIIAVAFPVTTVAYASPPSPFVGNWRGIDVDESDMRLVIAGPPNGPYRITWTESYISFCNGEAGIVRGMGSLSEEDPNLLQATLQVSCFTTGASTTFNLVWRYRPTSDTLISQYEWNGYVVIWHHPNSETPSFAIPTFVAYVPGAIEGYDWQLGDMVSIDINDGDYNAKAEVEESPWDPAQTRVLFEVWRDEISIEAGDHIVMTDGIVSKDVIVTNLAVTDIDVAAGTVSGVYNPDYSLWVWLYDGEGQVPDANPETGTWTATFTELPPGAWGGATQWEPDGDGTSLDFQVPNPEIRVWLGNQRVEGYQWPLAAWVDLYIDGNFIDSQQVQGDEYGTFVGFGLNGWVLAPEQEVTMSGGGIEKTHTILPVSITSVDTELNIVEGTASGDGTIILCIYDGGCEPPTEVLADGSGYWQNDYGDQFDIQPGFGMDATEFDEDGDGTSFDYWIPNPRLIAFPAVEEIFAYNWPEGSDVQLTINTDEFTQTTTVGPSSWDPDDIFAYFHFQGQYDLKPDDVVTLSGSGMELTYTVLNLSVTSVDAAADTVSGTTDPGASLTAAPFGFNDQALQVTADENGNWLANFAEANIDLVDGMCGRAEMYNVVTDNSTAVDWCIPNLE